jgi:transcriptional regulator
MYNYPEHKEEDRREILAFMKANPFVFIIGKGKGGRIEATQIPVMVEEKEGELFLYGHMAKKSDHHLALLEDPNALVIFTGPHTYVSGTWYAGEPQIASTWNYISVHARGKLKWMNEKELITFMQKLTLHFEGGNKNSSTIYDNLPTDYRDKLIRGIDGFEMKVTELDNVYKLSQNRDEKSYDNIVKVLKEKGGESKVVGEIMEKRGSPKER